MELREILKNWDELKGTVKFIRKGAILKDDGVENKLTEKVQKIFKVVGFNRLLTGLNYMLRGQGPGRQNFLEAGAFLKSRPDLDRPDLQLHCVLAIMKDHGKQSVAKDGFSVHVCQLRPESRGRVTLARTAPESDARAAALADEGVAAFTTGKALKKFIYVPGKIINLVVG